MPVEREPIEIESPFNAPIFTETLRRSAVSVGFPLTEQQMEQSLLYAERLLQTNTHTNLTRITEPSDIAIKHFADSLTVLTLPIPRSETPLRVCDVGTGAGFPGLVLKIARPHWKLTLLDSLQKRLTFLETVCDALHLSDVRFVHARAEEAGRNPILRDTFDIVTARAVAALPTLLEWCAPLVAVGGHFIALKSVTVDDELANATEAATQLKVRLVGDYSLQLPTVPGSGEPPAERRLLLYQKNAVTPARFPRSSAEIKRKPL